MAQLSEWTNEKHWIKQDAHTYVSVPVSINLFEKWKRGYDGRGRLTYKLGPYIIVRKPYGEHRFTYTVLRDCLELPLSFTGLLSQAKKHAAKNAAGLEIWNVA